MVWADASMDFVVVARVVVRNGEKNVLFAPFIYKNEHFTKTGSGQTHESWANEVVFHRDRDYGSQ